MDWRIPEKLKKGVSYARFSVTLRSMNCNVNVVLIADLNFWEHSAVMSDILGPSKSAEERAAMGLVNTQAD
jgi:hypothetical protein